MEINFNKLFLFKSYWMIPLGGLLCGFYSSIRFSKNARLLVTAYIYGRPFTILRLLGRLLDLKVVADSTCSLTAVGNLAYSVVWGIFSLPSLVVCSSMSFLA